MRDFRDETERAVWAAAFAKSIPASESVVPNMWAVRGAETHADYVLDRLREAKSADPAQPRAGELLSKAAVALHKLAARMPETPPAGECGDQSRLYYESLAEALEEWRKRLCSRSCLSCSSALSYCAGSGACLTE